MSACECACECVSAFLGYVCGLLWQPLLAAPTVLYSKISQIKRTSIYQENTKNNNNNFRNNYNFLNIVYSNQESNFFCLSPFAFLSISSTYFPLPPPPVNQFEIKTKSILKRNYSYLNEILNTKLLNLSMLTILKCKRVYKT